MSALFLCGAGNSEGVRLALLINRAEPRWDRIVLLDDDPALLGTERIGVPVVGPFERLADADPSADQVVNLVARTTAGRARAHRRIEAFGIPFAALVHPGVDTLGARLADDAIVYHNATIGPEVVIGGGCVVFMGAVVGHECRVGAHCVMAANSVLNARVELADRVYVGTNATIIPEVRVGEDCTIGAGSVLLFDLPAGRTAIGVPAVAVGQGVTEPSADLETVPREQVLAAVRAAWQAALDRSELSAHTNFFEAGGNSLAAARVCQLLAEHDGIPLPLVAFFRFPTVEAQVDFLCGQGQQHDELEAGRDRAKARRAALGRRRTATTTR